MCLMVVVLVRSTRSDIRCEPPDTFSCFMWSIVNTVSTGFDVAISLVAMEFDAINKDQSMDLLTSSRLVTTLPYSRVQVKAASQEEESWT
jgi:hypothetical protein